MAKVFGPLGGLAARGQMGGVLWFGCTPTSQVVRTPPHGHGNNQHRKDWQEKHTPKFSAQQALFKQANEAFAALSDADKALWSAFGEKFVSVDRCKMMDWSVNAKDIFLSFYLVCAGFLLPPPNVPAEITAETRKIWEVVQTFNYITKGKWVENVGGW